MVPSVCVTGSGTFTHRCRALKSLGRIFGRDDFVGDEERLHGDGDEGRRVLHDPMHDADIDVYVLPLAGFVAAGGALPADAVEGDGGEPRHFHVVVLMTLVLPFPVADHVVVVISRDGHRSWPTGPLTAFSYGKAPQINRWRPVVIEQR